MPWQVSHPINELALIKLHLYNCIFILLTILIFIPAKLDYEITNYDAPGGANCFIL